MTGYATYPQATAAQAQGRARIASLPSPVLGWNTRDALDQMDPRHAVVLDNWIPEQGKISARGGYETFIDDMSVDLGGTWAAAYIETLFTVQVGATEQFLAAHNGGISRIDTGTAAEIVVNGTYTSNRWQWITFAQSSAPTVTEILAVNGSDAPWRYDGTTHAAWSFAGPTNADVIWIYSFKNRVFAGEKDSRDFWYGPLGTRPGPGGLGMTRFPLSGIRGVQGNVLFMSSLTRDTGTGPDDFAVFVTTAGQAIVYAGTDPADSTAWSLVGVYTIPRPIPSRRAHAQLFGDLCIATVLDYIFLGQAIAESGAFIIQPSLLTGAIYDEALKYENNHGWEIITSPRDHLLISNVPRITNTLTVQHAFNVQTRAPTRFTGLNFSTWRRWRGNLYAGGLDGVYRVLRGLSDDASGTARPISLRAQSAWTDFGHGEVKRIQALRPLFRVPGEFKYTAELGIDFNDPTIVPALSIGPAPAATLWGDTPDTITLWGDTAATETYWSGTATAAPATARQWRLQGGRGTHFSLSLATEIKDQQVEWLKTDFKLTPAGRY